MSLKRKWLKALLMLMIAGAAAFGPVNPQEIEDLMRIMNQTRIEFTLADETPKGDGNP
jgi:hypothetical protein